MLDSNDPLLTAFVLGELDEQEQARVAAELAKSPELQQVVNEIRQATDMLSAGFTAEADLQLTDEQHERIEQTAGKPSVVPRTAKSPGLKIAITLVASAALILVGYVGYVQFFGSRGKQSNLAKAKLDKQSPAEQSSSEYRVAGAQKRADGQAAAGGWNARHDDFDQAPNATASNPTFSEDLGKAQRQYNLPPARRGSSNMGGMLGGSEHPTDQAAAAPGGDNSGGEERERAGMAVRPARVATSAGGSSTRPRSQELVDSLRSVTRLPREALQGRRNRSSGEPGRGLPDDDEQQGQAQGEEGAAAEKAIGGKEEDAKNAQSGKFKQDGKGKDNLKTQKRNWPRDRVLPNTSQLAVGTNDYLPIKGMQMNVQIDGFRARVLLDCYYYNDRNRQLQGSFKLRLPNEASLYYVAFGQTTMQYRPQVDKLSNKGFLTSSMVRSSGTGPEAILKARSNTWNNVKEAKMVPKAKAAYAYSETVRRRVDPALVEWTGTGVFQAKVFPLMPRKLHRIVIGYDVNLQQDGENLRYSIDVPSGIPETMVDVNVSALPGMEAKITPEAQPFLGGGRAYFHFNDPKQPRIDVELSKATNLMLMGKDDADADYFATRVTPDLPAGDKQAGSPRAMFLVDTSLSSNPQKFNVWLDLLEATLERNRDSMKEFAVLFFNVETHWWQEKYVANTRGNVAKLMSYCSSLALEGATDLGQAVSQAMSPSWAKGKQQSPQDSDVFLLSDGAVTWGEDNLYLITQKLQSNNATLFAYNTGYTGTAVQTLSQLARESGGAVFSVVDGNEVDKVATAHRSRPWQLIDATMAGSSDLLIAGRIRSIYPGQSLLLAGRGKAGSDIVLRVRRGSEEKQIRIQPGQIVQSDLVARTYGQVAVGQLEDLMTGVEDLATAYARHFRVTGQTCSLLMLESEQDYKRFNIRPQEDGLTVRTTSVQNVILSKLDELHKDLQDPKAQVMNWLKRLESTPGVKFRVPTGLRIQLEQLPQGAFAVDYPALICKQRDRDELPKKFFQQLSAQNLNYELVTAEAARRLEKYTAADALKVLSSLIESNPGDHVLARDVAFSAIEWKLGGQAYPLLKRVADARPYLPQVYQAMGQCLAGMDQAEMAIVCYEITMNGQWANRYQDIHSVCSVEYMRLLNRVANGELKSPLREYAKQRLISLRKVAPTKTADIVVTMMWNTDRTDVDLHVLEPSGEECYYKHRSTRTGGKITRDVTEGFGPEMYIIEKAPKGNFVVKANYYGSDANQTGLRTKVYVTVYENFGTKRERVARKTVLLNRGKEKRDLLVIERP